MNRMPLQHFFELRKRAVDYLCRLVVELAKNQRGLSYRLVSAVVQTPEGVDLVIYYSFVSLVMGMRCAPTIHDHF